MTGMTNCHPDTHVTETVTPASINGDTHVTRSVMNRQLTVRGATRVCSHGRGCAAFVTPASDPLSKDRLRKSFEIALLFSTAPSFSGPCHGHVTRGYDGRELKGVLDGCQG